MASLSTNYLVTLKGRSGFYAQRAVPKELQSQLGTKLWRRKAGNTLSEARRFLAGFLAETEALIESCKQQRLPEQAIRLTRQEDLLLARGRAPQELHDLWPQIEPQDIERVSKLPAVPLLTAEQLIEKATLLKQPARGTIREWENCFKLFTEHTGLTYPLAASKEDAVGFRDALLTTHKASTTRKVIRFLRAHWQLLVDEEVLQVNIWNGISKHVREEEKTAKAFDPALVDPLAEALNPDQQRLYWVLRYTGLRIVEALGLKPEEIDLNNRVITITDNEHRSVRDGIKSPSSRRTIPISKALAARLEGWSIPADAPLVFPFAKSSSGRLTTPRFLRSKLGIGPHTLRHHVVTALREAGFNERVSGALLGHSASGEAITSQYGMVTMDALRDAVEKIY